MKGTSVATVRKEESAWDVIKTVVYALLIALVIRTLAFEPFNIPSGSMTPTLLTGDYVFVSKYSYGYSRYSLPFAPDFLHGRIFGRKPERGDVAVFINPHTGEDYIKRIVGLPGDHIQVINGILNINGKPVERIKMGDYVQGGGGSYRAATLYNEVLPNGRRHEIIENSDNGPSDNTPEFTVPPNHFFMMGDNRDDSLDSRTTLMLSNGPAAQLGWYVPAENLVGRAEFIFFSHDPAAAGWLEPWKWPSAVRFGRFFMAIH